LLWTLLLPVLALSHPARSQERSLDQLLSGRALPLSISPKDLNGDYRRMIVNDQSTMGNLQSMMVVAQTGVEMNLYFTKGETVAFGGETYLIAYRPQVRIDPDLLNRHGHNDAPKEAQKLRPATKLALSLLNLRTVSSLNDIRPFDAKLDVETPQEGEAATIATLDRLGRDFTTWIRTRGRGTFPALGAQVTPELMRAMYPQVHDRRQWQHPVSNQFFRPNPALSKLKLSTIRNSRTLIMFSEATPAPDGSRAVLFVDGHVERVPAARWTQLQAIKPVTAGAAARPVNASFSSR
ncbi:MAG TPA: hypothetical protein VF627_09590, partial [Abditibacterium sp.]